MRILAQDTMAVGIDYQEKLIPAIFEKEKIVDHSVILFEGLNELGIPVLITEQYPKGLGNTVHEIDEATKTATVLEKMTFSCYETESIKKAIDASGKKNILLSGTEAHVCVLQSAIDLLSAGYHVIVVTDCAGSRTEYCKHYGLKRAEKEGATLTSYEAILFELLRTATSPSFKAISKLVK